jgi:hypothetical protein
MQPPQYLIAAYCLLVATALIAVHRWKPFPMTSAIMAVLGVGFGFTAIVYVLVPSNDTILPHHSQGISRILFLLVYLCLTAYLLPFQPYPKYPDDYPSKFLPKSIQNIVFKLVLFVFVPLGALRLFWRSTWQEFGLNLDNLYVQSRTVVLLILIFGGIGFVHKGGLRAIRERRVSVRQAVLGYLVGFLLEIFSSGMPYELFFRAMLQRNLSILLGSPVAAICLTSFLYSASTCVFTYKHPMPSAEILSFRGDPPSFFNSLIGAILLLGPPNWWLGILYFRTQSIFVPILVRAGVDAVGSIPACVEGLDLDK